MAKYSKFKTKIHPLTYIIGVIFLALIAVVIIFSVPKKSEAMYRDYYNAQIRTEQFNQELLMTKDHLYKTISVASLEKEVDSKGLVIVYVGGTWCSNCLNEVSIYSSELEKNEELLAMAENIYYLEKPKDKEIKGFNELLEKLELDPVTSYPALLTFYNGKLVETKYVVGAQEPKGIRTTVALYFDKVLAEVK